MGWLNIVATIALLANIVGITGYSIKEIVAIYTDRKNNKTLENRRKWKLTLSKKGWLLIIMTILLVILFKRNILVFKFTADWDMADIYTEKSLILTNVNYDKSFNLALGNKADNLKEATGKFQLLDKNKKSLSNSSGFIISSDGILVVPAFSLKNKDAVAAKFMTDKKQYKVERVLNYSSTFDIALLKLVLDKEEKTKHLTLGDAKKVSEGDSITLVGTPAHENNTLNHLNMGTISKEIYLNEFGLYEILGEITLENGQAGGPVFDANDRVIGICRTYSANGANKSLITPINTLEFLLRSSSKGKVSLKELNNKINQSYAIERNTHSGERVSIPEINFVGTVGYNLNTKLNWESIFRKGTVSDNKSYYQGLVHSNFTNNTVDEYILDWDKDKLKNNLIIQYGQGNTPKYRYGKGKIDFSESKKIGIFNGDSVNVWYKNEEPVLDLVKFESNNYSNSPVLQYDTSKQTISNYTSDEKKQLQGKFIKFKENKITISNYQDGKMHGSYCTVELDNLDEPLVYKGSYENDTVKEKIIQDTSHFRRVDKVEKQIKWRMIENGDSSIDIIYFEDGSWKIKHGDFQVKIDKNKDITLSKELEDRQFLSATYEYESQSINTRLDGNSDASMIGSYNVKNNTIIVKKENDAGEIVESIKDNGESIYLSENVLKEQFKGIIYYNNFNLYIGNVVNDKVQGFGVRNHRYMSYIGYWEKDKLKRFYVNEYEQGVFEESGIVKLSN